MNDNFIDMFLGDEISCQDFYEGIVDFIISYNIRCGEYECNRFIIKKMDLMNFIIFVEYEIEGNREIHSSISINKNKLISVINRYAKKQGFVLRRPY